jgi:hypothetical protein
MTYLATRLIFLATRLTFLALRLAYLALKLTCLALRLTYLALRLTYLAIRLTFLALRLTYLAIRITFLALRLTYVALILTYLVLRLIFLAIRLTYLAPRLTYLALNSRASPVPSWPSPPVMSTLGLRAFVWHRRHSIWNNQYRSDQWQLSESIVTLPPFGPIKGHKWFFSRFPMRVSEEPVWISLFRQNPVFISLHLGSPVHVVPPQEKYNTVAEFITIKQVITRTEYDMNHYCCACIKAGCCRFAWTVENRWEK